MSIPAERRGVGAAAGATTLAAVVIAVSAVVAWDSRETTAVVAVVVSIVALTVACAGLAGYMLWLRQAVSGRMARLLRPYLAPLSAADGMSVRAGLIPIAAELTLVASTAEN